MTSVGTECPASSRRRCFWLSEALRERRSYGAFSIFLLVRYRAANLAHAKVTEEVGVMTLIVRVMALAAVLMVLALAVGPVSAEELPDGPTVAACPAGSGYASGCDVDQDNDIDILDVQRTAGHWNSTGVFTPGHTHWGETWTGATVGHGLFLDNTAASDTAYGLSARSASTNGTGVYAWANSPTGSTYSGPRTDRQQAQLDQHAVGRRSPG